MKLTTKLVSVFLAIAILLLAVDGYFSVRRERELFEGDLRRDAEMIAGAVTRLVRDVGRAEGLDRAMELLADLNRQQTQLQIRAVWLDEPSEGLERPRARLPAADLGPPGSPLFLRQTAPDGTEYFLTYHPLRLGDRTGAIEIRQPLDEMNSYLRASATSSIWLAAALTLLCVALVVPVGLRMVGRPLGLLAEKARRVGEGDLSTPVPVVGHDELGELATAMNHMSDHLAALLEKLRAETAERIAAVEKLRHADRLRTVGQLASGVAHELGTPLNVVSGRASQIATGSLSADEAAEAARIIKTQCERMTGIIRQLLHFARRQSPRKSSVDLHQLARQTMSLLEPIARKCGVVLHLETDTAAQASVDASQVEQVLTNLLVNAIDAMPEGGTATVSIRRQSTAEASDCLRIDVRDGGPGIAEDHLDQLFEPFFTTKDVGRGTGLGLSIAHGIVAEHGGRIEVESELGKGTCFSVYLPQSTKE